MIPITHEYDNSWTMSLGEIVDELIGYDKDLIVCLGSEGYYPNEFMSYRGYYDNLAIDTTSTPKTVGDFILQCENTDGMIFTGYKGGEYRMSSDTPVWADEYGRYQGIGIVGVRKLDNHVLLVTKVVD